MDESFDRKATPGPASISKPVPLSIVVPAYNEAARIERSLEQTLDFLARTDRNAEVVVVDDGSRDATALVVEQFAATHPTVRLVRMASNRGKGAAIRAGVAASRGDRVLMMDADLATPIDELLALERALDGGAEV